MSAEFITHHSSLIILHSSLITHHSSFCTSQHVTVQSTEASLEHRVQRSEVGLPENSWRSLQLGHTA
jgi:hypothetical protein